MDEDEKKLLKEALENKEEDERYNQALSKVVSEESQGKDGYKKYLDLIQTVRDRAEKEECSVEEAVKKITNKNTQEGSDTS